MQSSKVGFANHYRSTVVDLCHEWVAAAERLLAEAETGALPDEATFDVLSRAQLMIDAHNDRCATPRSPRLALQSCAGHTRGGNPVGWGRKPLRDGSGIYACPWLVAPETLLATVPSNRTPYWSW